MRSITEDEFQNAVSTFDVSAVHLEMRDAYGTAAELPYFDKWLAGESDDLAWLDGWCDTLRRLTAEGKTVRRARIVSEPLSDYQRWSLSIAHPLVAAGEDIRWVPRRLVSTLVLPGNDFYLLDDRRVIFLTYAGNGTSAGFDVTDEHSTVELCRTAFEAVWQLSVPHSEYQAD